METEAEHLNSVRPDPPLHVCPSAAASAGNNC